jgi:hypothetical protein
LKPRYRTYIIIISLLLHILLLLIWEGAIRMKWISLKPELPPQVEQEPIVFDMQQQQTLPKQVIETPQDAKVVEQQKKADFLSDKNALARNPETNPELNEGSPFSRGIFDTHELPVTPSQPGQNQPEPPRDQTKENDSDKKPSPELEERPIETDAEVLYKKFIEKQQKEVKPGSEEQLPTVPHDDQQSRALDMGGLSFNTYNWDFAPYMLMLKARVQRNILPPPAFTLLGMISGDTLLRFKIYPNGEMRDLEILGYNGHKSLMITSQNAITRSAPFPELPSHFPEQYLEVTGKFIYFIQREGKHGERRPPDKNQKGKHPRENHQGEKK